MSDEQDTRKTGTKLTALIVTSGLLLFGGGYFLWSWLGPEDVSTLSAVNINSTAGGGAHQVEETPRYRELLRADNDRGAAAAARNNQSFIASMPRGLDVPDTPDSPPADNKPADTGHRPPPSEPKPEDRAVTEKRRERLQALLTRITAQQGSGQPPVVAAAMWNRTPPQPGASPAGPRAELQTTSLATPQPGQGIQLIPALTRVPARLETAVDSDNASSKVIATIPAGPWAGATLYSPEVRLAGNGVEIRFDRMSWNGMNLKVNAVAQRPDNLMSSVASDVNTRWFKHIVLPSVLGGIGGVGTLYRDANTQVIQGNYGTVTGRVGMPDGGAVAGVIAGGMAERGSQILTRQAESEPYKQVLVKQHEVVSILFIDPVMTGDELNMNTGTPAPSSVPSAGTTPFSQARLQAAVAQRKAATQRRYDDEQENMQ